LTHSTLEATPFSVTVCPSSNPAKSEVVRERGCGRACQLRDDEQCTGSKSHRASSS
jgi:hypothetical protein